MKHYTVPVFVPELACPNRCVFCNQNSISGCHNQPDNEEVIATIEKRLETIPPDNTSIDIGFFGGNFTGIDEELQAGYLSIANNYLKEGRIHGIRLSTRPDYITPQSLDLLKRYNVTTIELGAQSLDPQVLKLAGRGHTVEDIERAARLITGNGFHLGLQMMTGLPGDTPEKSVVTARRIIELGASCTRIYPTLVIRDTELEQQWRNGTYIPQSLEEAVELSATLIGIFKDAGVNVIRVGLHPSDDLIKGNDMLAGPFHVSFRQLAETRLWRRKLEKLIQSEQKESEITVAVPEDELNEAIGYNGSNREMLLRHFSRVNFTGESSPSPELPLIIADKRIPLPAKNTLRQTGRLMLLESSPSVYKSISGHPDIFMCAGDGEVVVSPDFPADMIHSINEAGYKVYKGRALPGRLYPESAVYNAVVTGRHLIHNLKITDPEILHIHSGKKHIHVNQGYTRCNLLPLDDSSFITSDRGIEKTLRGEGFEVLYADPAPVVLKGQKHGFFPGCCGVLNKTVLMTGSLNHHHQKEEITEFILSKGFGIKELFDGKLTDTGSILILKSLTPLAPSPGGRGVLETNLATKKVR